MPEELKEQLCNVCIKYIDEIIELFYNVFVSNDFFVELVGVECRICLEIVQWILQKSNSFLIFDVLVLRQTFVVEFLTDF